ncbi:MAG TPA: hypothetical protein VG273_00620 [Bryobacteraceae bacterium]|jgi:hypothetical protein|nr:hypothetical protein [Bryobacteraceae bacterium]
MHSKVYVNNAFDPESADEALALIRVAVPCIAPQWSARGIARDGRQARRWRRHL